MISIVAKFIVNTGEEAKFMDLMSGLIKASQAEKGCVEYVLHKDVEKPLTYCLIERWKDQAAIDEHNSTPHFTGIVPQIIQIAKAEIDVYKPV